MTYVSDTKCDLCGRLQSENEGSEWVDLSIRRGGSSMRRSLHACTDCFDVGVPTKDSRPDYVNWFRSILSKLRKALE